MMAWRGLRRIVVAGWLVVALLTPAGALADGDPASDILLGQDVFLPYSAISQHVQRELYAVTAAARHAGYPVKLALIAGRSDLGVVPALFGRPAAYARFLSAELAGVVNGPVLVVMPAGFGLAAAGHGLSTAALSHLPPPASASADGLGTAAVSAVGRLAARSGHPLPAGSAARGSGLGASPATVQHAELALGVMAALAGGALAAAFTLRARRGLDGR